MAKYVIIVQKATVHFITVTLSNNEGKSDYTESAAELKEQFKTNESFITMVEWL